MAKPKQQVLTEILDPDGVIRIWLNNPGRHTQEILDTNGVSEIWGVSSKSVTISLDPRYDMDEVIADLEQLLISEVPDVFNEF